MGDYETIVTEVKEQTGWIILSREERRNALNPQMLKELQAALSEFDNNADVVSIVLTGAGEKSFCSGMDLGGGEMMQLSFLERHEVQRQFIDVFKKIRTLQKPLIGRVQGTALGGGLGLACACDLVVAAKEARLGTPEINLGLFPYIIMATLLRVANNRKKLLELMYTGEKITAEQAHTLGLVSDVVTAEELDQKVAEVTGKINQKSPAILRLGRRSFYNIQDMDYEEAMEYLSGMLALNMQAEDMVEGVAAFMEKRQPNWQGK